MTPETLFGEAQSTRRSMGSHQAATGGTDEWLTPPELIAALGAFDLDPCAPIVRPWPTAVRHYTLEDDGLRQPWEGRVWLNPPYGNITRWMARMVAHNHGTALTFARTETMMWHEYIWPNASAILFLRGRIVFRLPDGTPAKANAGAPSVLITYGEADALALETSGIPGKVVRLT